MLAILQFAGAGIWLVGAVFAWIGQVTHTVSPDPDAGAVVVGTGIMGILQLVCGIGLWKIKPYGRVLQIGAACIGLVAIPIGTVVSIAILIYMFKPGIKLLFSGRPGETLTATEVEQVNAVLASSTATTVVRIVVVALLVIAIVGILAAIAIPGLLRARIGRNEANAIGTLQAIASAEAAYATSNRGLYDSLDCLAQPSNCLPNHQGSAFINETYDRKSGYRFLFQPGDRPTSLPVDASRTSVRTFAVIAMPISTATGTRHFCVDDTRELRFAVETEGLATDGRCPASWRLVK